jgi:hypothetical protein
VTTYTRPVVRSFSKRFVRECAAWVRAGGHAILWDSPKRARLVLPAFGPKDTMALARWAILDLGKSTFGFARAGALRGLVTTPIPKDTLFIVREWATRDSIHAKPTRRIALDCLACGACCRDNEVVLEKQDARRFRKARLEKMLQPPYARRKNGRLMLRVLANGKCTNLERDNKCAIYEARPDACRFFPAASECCLFAREEELGIIDGVDYRE